VVVLYLLLYLFAFLFEALGIGLLVVELRKANLRWQEFMSRPETSFSRTPAGHSTRQGISGHWAATRPWKRV
jgi:hypothetical protein